MNQRLRVALAVAGIAIYAIWCATKAYGHDAQVPHTHADMVVVSTMAFNNISGATNDINTNVNLQTVLDAIDNSTLPTASNIVINTNNFQYFAPTNAYLQTLLDWQDDNALTNISNTNIYMTGVQNSNAFVGTGTTAFIRDSGGAVSNKHLSGGIINYTNLEPGYMKMPRIAGFTQTSVSNSGVGSGAASVSLIVSTQVSRSSFLYGYAILGDTRVPNNNATNVQVGLSIWVGPTNGGVFKQVYDQEMVLNYYTGTLAGLNQSWSVPFCIPIAASNWYTMYATAVNSNAVQSSTWYVNWSHNITDATLP